MIRSTIQGQVEERAKGCLGSSIDAYKPTRLSTSVDLPANAEVTFELYLPSFDVYVPRRTFLWINPVHMEEFRIRAIADLQGDRSHGNLRISHGNILRAEVPITITVDANAPERDVIIDALAEAKLFRNIFASYSHKDTENVEHFEKFVETLGDRYLPDVFDLRAGRVWSDELEHLIRNADVFQLFWSNNAMASEFAERSGDLQWGSGDQTSFDPPCGKSRCGVTRRHRLSRQRREGPGTP